MKLGSYKFLSQINVLCNPVPVPDSSQYQMLPRMWQESFAMSADGITCPQRNHTPGAYHLVAVLMDFKRRKVQKVRALLILWIILLILPFGGQQESSLKAVSHLWLQMRRCVVVAVVIPESRGSVLLLHVGFALFPTCLKRHSSGRQDLGSVPLTWVCNEHYSFLGTKLNWGISGPDAERPKGKITVSSILHGWLGLRRLTLINALALIRSKFD